VKKGFFIVFEGIDGAGLTTNSKYLNEWLTKKNIKSIYTKEPTDSELGKIIRNYLKQGADPYFLTLLFTTDRFLHVKNVILPALKEKIGVICDRYYYSTIAYQSVHGVKEKIIRDLNKFCPKPNLVFLLDIPPEISLKRKGNKREMYENEKFLNEVRKKYLELAFEENFIIINTNDSLENVNKKIIEVCSLFLDEIGIKC